jgi:hypothetical protein
MAGSSWYQNWVFSYFWYFPCRGGFPLVGRFMKGRSTPCNLWAPGVIMNGIGLPYGLETIGSGGSVRWVACFAGAAIGTTVSVRFIW